ncbi:methionyl-tRNA formyltransferase [Monaibacterium marinum]|uniref:Methionyl-tRNA formyltransferase n=1 Tax=Pontivivens marinum TaxID=1690039 RepID=A0A2C9CUR8_9RHOB|nr:methionyl-tRNA formyltransferase [Monaibacterium marinum]SOH95064.1 methionyl-tRNA formyltransferase [Monaibacterium marinum]
MRLIFMGTPDFSVTVLDALIAAGHEIVSVYTQPPRPAGRGKKDRPTAVHARAADLGLDVRHPRSLRGAPEQAYLAALNADAAVVVAYGLILPQAVLDAPRLGCFNIHASLLPRWRGAAPIQRAIMAGDAESGVCIMQMDAGLDTGDVLLREATALTAHDTAATLHDRLAEIGSRLMVDSLEALPNLTAVPQPAEGVTYAAKIDKAEAKIDWSQPAEHVDRQIRGLAPFPGAWTMHGGKRLKLHLSALADGTGPAGTALDDELTIACGTGAVKLIRLQREGRGVQDAGEFLRGHPIYAGNTLGD